MSYGYTTLCLALHSKEILSVPCYVGWKYMKFLSIFSMWWWYTTLPHCTSYYISNIYHLSLTLLDERTLNSWIYFLRGGGIPHVRLTLNIRLIVCPFLFWREKNIKFLNIFTWQWWYTTSAPHIRYGSGGPLASGASHANGPLCKQGLLLEHNQTYKFHETKLRWKR